MDRLPNWLKWLVVALVFAVLAVMVLAVDRRASRTGSNGWWWPWCSPSWR